MEEETEKTADSENTNEIQQEIEKTETFSDIVKEISEEEKESSKKEETIEEKEQKKEENQTEESTKQDKKKFSKGVLIGCIVFTIALLFFSTIFAILNMNNRNILQGVFFENVNVSGMSNEEINEVVEKRISKIEEIVVTDEEYSVILKTEDIGLSISGKEGIQKALALGKTNHIILDNYQILKTKLLKTRYHLEISVNEEKLANTIKNIEAEMPGAMKEYAYEIDKQELVITVGKAGKIIQKEKLKQAIIQNIIDQFNQEETDQKEIVVIIPIQTAEPEQINIEKIHKEIQKEAKDAYIVEDPFELHKDEDGVDFGVTMEEAKTILQEEKETYRIPLKITKANVTVKDLGDQLFKQTLSKYTTIYDAGNTNRASNIALAAKTINGTILLPGETFSYNGILGNTTKEKGYKLGGAYVAGKVVEAYGGGICQVSSTIYNAVLYANLEIVERHNHTYTVTYVPAGRDATVSYGGKDFKFKNSRMYPIKIEANAKNGVISVSIKGIKEEKEYEIVLTSQVLSTTPAPIVYEKNSSLAEGQEKVIQKGHSGQKSIAYKTIKYNGKTISKTVLSKDTYQPMNRIIQKGTKKVTIPTPTPVTPEATPASTEPTEAATTTTVQTNEASNSLT